MRWDRHIELVLEAPKHVPGGSKTKTVCRLFLALGSHVRSSARISGHGWAQERIQAQTANQVQTAASNPCNAAATPKMSTGQERTARFSPLTRLCNQTWAWGCQFQIYLKVKNVAITIFVALCAPDTTKMGFASDHNCYSFESCLSTATGQVTRVEQKSPSPSSSSSWHAPFKSTRNNGLKPCFIRLQGASGDDDFSCSVADALVLLDLIRPPFKHWKLLKVCPKLCQLKVRRF